MDDRLLGTLVALGGGAYAAVAFSLPGVPGQAYGPGFFPSIIGIATTLSGLALAARSFARKPAAPPPAHAAEPADATERPQVRLAGVVRFVGILAAVAFYYLAADTLGFVLSSLVIVTALGLLLGGRIVTTVLVAIGATVVLSVVFGRLLRVPLPVGPLDLL